MNKFKNAVQSTKARVAALVALSTVVMAQQANAALPEGVSDAVSTYQTDALAAIALVMAAGVAIWGLKKLGQKLGWL